MKNKFTVVIPTLWQSKRIFKLINDLHESEEVGEVILIDNTNELERYKDGFEKVNKLRVYQPGENLFVAASWNKGVELARHDLIAVSNDDVNFNCNVFSNHHVEKALDGIIGQASNNYHINSDEPFYLEDLPATRPWGWGCLMLFDKKNWVPVPNELRVWYNDDFINKYNPAPQYVLHGLKIETEMSTTSDQPEWDTIKKQDQQIWTNIVRERG